MKAVPSRPEVNWKRSVMASTNMSLLSPTTLRRPLMSRQRLMRSLRPCMSRAGAERPLPSKPDSWASTWPFFTS